MGKNKSGENLLAAELANQNKARPLGVTLGGVEMYATPQTWGETQKFETLTRARNDGEVDNYILACITLVHKLCDGNGARLFDVSDIDDFRKLDSLKVSELITAMNKATDQTEEAAGKL